MSFLHEAQLANTVTGFATCAAGLWPLVFSAIAKPRHPARWVFFYFTVLLTGIPTVAFHAHEESKMLAALDTGSNLVVAWAMQIALCYDFLAPRWRKWIVAPSTVANLAAFVFMLNEAWTGIKKPFFDFGDFGNFYTGEVVLILDSWVGAALLLAHLGRVPRGARPLLYFTVFQFFIGMLLASASVRFISHRIFAWHATWHLLGAFGFMTFWVFNHMRFIEGGDPAAGREQRR